MNPQKPTHADVLKKPSAYLNPGMDPTPLIPKPARVRLSEEAVQNLRSVIRGQRKSEVESSAKVSTKQATNQPLVLASASAGILPGFAMGDRHFMQSSVNSAYVSILKPNKIGVIVRAGVKENPIDVADDSDDEFVKSEESKSFDHYSVDGCDISVDTAGEFFNEVVDEKVKVTTGFTPKETPELNITLRLNPTKTLTKAKRRMENSFVDDYVGKIKSFKR